MYNRILNFWKLFFGTHLLCSAWLEEASIAAAAAGDAMATICLVAPPLLKEEFLTGAELRSAFKSFWLLESSLFKTQKEWLKL